MIKTVLVFGDSLAWGRVPGAAARYPVEQRWPSLLQKQLGPDRCEVVVDAIPGRTTVFDEPFRPHRNGLVAIDLALIRHAPIDLVILALGTNDLQDLIGAAPEEIALGLEALVKRIRSFTYDPVQAPPAILLVVPPPLEPAAGIVEIRFRTARQKWPGLCAATRTLGAATECGLVDLSSLVTVDTADGLHVSAAENERIAAEMALHVRPILFA